MRIFIAFEGERYVFDIVEGTRVSEVRKDVQQRFMLGGDQAGKPDRKIVVLSYAGADLKDNWIFTDIGINPGATIRISEREEIKPRLFVHCAYNHDVIKIMDEIDMQNSIVGDLRGIVSGRSGLPVGVFKLLTKDRQELFDCNKLEAYNLTIGDTILLEVWDGWTDFLNLCILGFSSHVLSQISQDETEGRFQMKVALYLAAHFGHPDLASSLMRQGVRPDIPIGYHPSRQWCDANAHIDSFKTPIHECAEAGQVSVLRTFVNNNVCSIVAKDANGKTPFQIALRAKQKGCAGFLLAKQWSRIQYGPVTTGLTLPLNLYSRLKDWGDRAKDKAYLKYGQSKSSLKRRPFVATSGTLVGVSVEVDGFKDKEWSHRKKQSFLVLEKDKISQPEIYFKSSMQKNEKHATFASKISKNKLQNFGKLASKTKIGDNAKDQNSVAGDSRPPSAQSHATKPMPAKVLQRKNSQSSSNGEEQAKVNADENNNTVIPDQSEKSALPFAKTGRPSTIPELIEDVPSFGNDNAKHSIIKTVRKQPAIDNVENETPPKSRRDERQNFSNAPKPKIKPGPAVIDTTLPKDAIFKSIAGDGKIGEKIEDENGAQKAENCRQASPQRARSGRSQEEPSTRFPPINQRVSKVSQSQPNLSTAGNYIQTGQGNAEAEDENKKRGRSKSMMSTRSEKDKRERSVSVQSAMKFVAAGQADHGVSLPVISLENRTRPYLHHVRSKSDDPALSTLALYEKYRGLEARDYAIKCLAIANNFKDKPWLQQVRLAMTLTAQGVRKPVANKPSFFKEEEIS